MVFEMILSILQISKVRLREVKGLALVTQLKSNNSVASNCIAL